MALCIECRTALPQGERECPACGAARLRVGASAGRTGAGSVDPWPALDSELTIAEVRLRPTAAPGATPAEDRDEPARPPRRSWVADNDLALCAVVLGVVSVIFALLGHGWFGIVAVGCGHQARRQASGSEAGGAGRRIALVGSALGVAAIGMMLRSLAGT